MEIDTLTVYNSLTNLGFEKINSCIGTVVKMDAASAYLFANVTGAVYLDNYFFPFSPKGTTKILASALGYKFVTGIFDGKDLKYSPVMLSETKPYLFSGNKKIAAVEFKSETEYRLILENLIKEISDNDEDTTDYIILRIEKSKNGNGMEPFLEYLACEYFKKRGYIVENQVPLFATTGTPDFGGYKLLNSDIGFQLIELSMIRITKDISLLNELEIKYAIVGEAKTSTKEMSKQLSKYLDTSLFKRGYEIHPDKREPAFNYFGLLNIDDNGNTKCYKPKEKYTNIFSSAYDFDEYAQWYNNYLKFYIIANFTNNELKDFILRKSPKGKYNADKIISVIINTPLCEIISEIKEVI